jgi:hypothetical protein
MKKWFSIKWLIPGFILLVVVVLYAYNRPVKKNTVLMSTPLIYRDSRLEPFHPAFYGNERSSSLSLGIANVRLGSGEMNWPAIRTASLMEKRSKKVPLNIERIEALHKIDSGKTI